MQKIICLIFVTSLYGYNMSELISDRDFLLFGFPLTSILLLFTFEIGSQIMPSDSESQKSFGIQSPSFSLFQI